MAQIDRAWYEEDKVYVDVVSRGTHVSRVRYVIEPGIELDFHVLNEDLVFQEEEDDDL